MLRGLSFSWKGDSTYIPLDNTPYRARMSLEPCSAGRKHVAAVLNGASPSSCLVVMGSLFQSLRAYPIIRYLVQEFLKAVH